MLGRFHEVSIATADIRASVEFYELLGFTHVATGDTWTHPYGVLTDGRLFLGLHQFPGEHSLTDASPIVTFVHAGVAQLVPALETLGVELEFVHTGDDVFNEVGFRDPTGQLVRVLEARTYSPPANGTAGSLCGYFAELGLPAAGFDEPRRFWEALGFVATEEAETPYVHQPLTSDHLNIAFHRPRVFDRPLLVFSDEDTRTRIATLRERDVPIARELPRGLAADANAVIEAPEGTTLLLRSAPDV